MEKVKQVGHKYLGNGRCWFRVWAPLVKEIALAIVKGKDKKLYPLKRDKFGYWETTVKEVYPNTNYYYLIEGKKRPDPASFYQPDGVHGYSQVISLDFDWNDNSWQPLPLKDLIIYELHVGTFTRTGDFYGVIKQLDRLKSMGINAIEIMPVAQFPGERNWGYDGVFPFAVQNSYGGPPGLFKLVDQAHKKNISVILDVVYNHLGPEGNILGDFAPYFTTKYRTFWGKAVNFDHAYSDSVRNYFIFNALYWFKHFHIDALRLDAVHSIYDMSAVHFLQELKKRVEVYNRSGGKPHYLIAESDLNDNKIIKDSRNGGYGMDAQWSDDYHHCIHAILTGERDGYYMDFGKLGHFRKALREGYTYGRLYSLFRKKTHGSRGKDMPAEKFIVFSQNHDQIGNRALGERLPELVPFEALKVSAALVLLSPYIPLIFMGEEYAEENPFLYFTSHQDKKLAESVTEGRKEEFSGFSWENQPPNPQELQTFLNSKLDYSKLRKKKHKVVADYYREVIGLRRADPILRKPGNKNIKVDIEEEKKTMVIERPKIKGCILYLVNFSITEKSIYISNKGKWEKLLDSADKKWLGPGPKLPQTIKEKETFKINSLNIAIYKKSSHC
ncbi:MAG: malto-oligosyltrehalose trehalohydrolase [Candidatus Humimicrobiaceae bacterium]